MFEIEMKAHVNDKNKIEQKLFAYGKFIKKVLKNDTYYSKPADNPQELSKDHISIRIREETFEDGCQKNSTFFLTYKRKEKIDRTDKKSSEVNDEKECTLSDDLAIKSFLNDCGFSISLRKTKTVSCFEKEFEQNGIKMKATLELCTLEELGHFLEIEVLSETNEVQKVQMIKNKIISIFDDLGIEEKDFETRYYSEMLEEARKNALH